MQRLSYEVSGDGGFVAIVDGFSCFITPSIKDSLLTWEWCIQSGGGWTSRGGDKVVTHKEGCEFSVSLAEQALLQALNECP